MQESHPQSPRGVVTEDHRFLRVFWDQGGASTPGSWGEREAESHILLNVESGTFSSGFMHFTEVGKIEEQDTERLGVGWQGPVLLGPLERTRFDFSVSWGIGPEAGTRKVIWQLHFRVP